MEQQEGSFNLENVHGKTTYELRQEVDRRKLKLPENVNHNTLMQCLVQDLMRVKDEKERELFEKYEEERENLKQRLLQEKNQRKAEALKRSAERQKREKEAQEKATQEPTPISAENEPEKPETK